MSYIGNVPTNVAFLTDQFNGNGSLTAFTLSAAPANTNSILVAVSGVLQDPTTYSVSGTTLTFSAAPPAGTGNISVRFLGIPASGVTTTAYRTQTEFTATAGQTTFSVPSYTVGYIDVYRNGALLGSADFTATNGTTVVLAAGASAGDLVETVSFYVSSVLNAIPATNGAVTSAYLLDGSVTQAKLGTNVAGTGPAFSASITTTTSISNNTFTKITYDNEIFDTNNNYTNSKFTPTIAGYYYLTASLSGLSSFGTNSPIAIFKNGGWDSVGVNVNGYATVNALFYANGTTDYFEVYQYQNSGTTQSTSAQTQARFSGCLVRAA